MTEDEDTTAKSVTTEETVRAALPELDAIEDDDLRARVTDAWATAIEENAVEDLTTVPWLSPE